MATIKLYKEGFNTVYIIDGVYNNDAIVIYKFEDSVFKLYRKDSSKEASEKFISGAFGDFRDQDDGTFASDAALQTYLNNNTGGFSQATGSVAFDPNTIFGWALYADSETAPATQIITTTPTLLQIDGLGAGSSEVYLPSESTSFWDTTNDKLLADNDGDGYILRMGVEVISDSGNPTYIHSQLDIGGTALPTIVVSDRISTIPKIPPFSLGSSFNYFALATFITNGGQFFMSTDTGTVTIGRRTMLVNKISSGV